MTEQDRIINDFINELADGSDRTIEEIVMKIFELGYNTGFLDGQEDLRRSDVE